MNNLLTVDDMLKAGRLLMECVLRDELDDADSEYKGKVQWYDAFEHVNEKEMLAVVARIVGQIDQAWKYEVGLVFNYMNVEDNSDALYYLIMACLGHGVGLEDDYSKDLQQARKKLKAELNHAPIYLSSPFDSVVFYAIANHLKEVKLQS